MARTYSLFRPYEVGRRTGIRDDVVGGVVQLETTARLTGLQDTTGRGERVLAGGTGRPTVETEQKSGLQNCVWGFWLLLQNARAVKLDSRP